MRIFKKIKKVLIVISTVLITLLLNIIGVANSVYAAHLGSSAKLIDEGSCGELLNYNGAPVITTYISYNDGTNSYPAYCLNANIPGVGEKGSYTVSTNELVTDVGLWRRVINGYPYKTVSQLGCNNKKEAFTATKHAIYCYVHGTDPSNYSAIGEAGKRTLNAMNKIIKAAEESNDIKLETSININKNLGKWSVDSIDKKYISKTYEVTANADFKKYTISMQKLGNSNLPEGIKITDEKNKAKTTFNKGEKFKVLIPINNLKNNGDFILNVKSEMNTKPVLYGKAPNSGLQDYAITTLKYEDGTGSVTDSYGQNETKIVVLKKDKNTQKPLEGVTFNLLDENKKVIYSDLKTNKEGKIEIKGLMPGKYYLVETSTLSGYVKYDEDIEIDIELNEEFDVTVNNSKENTIEVDKSKKELSVSKELANTQVNTNKESTELVNTQVNINKESTEINKKETIKKLPVTGM